MEVFVYNAAKPREEITAFNQRLRAYCDDNPVVAIDAEMLGPSLVVSLTHAEDLQVELSNTFATLVVPISGLEDKLEEILTDVLDTIASEHSDDDPRIPADIDVVYRPDIPTEGFAIINIINGELVSDGDGAGDEDDIDGD